METQPIATNQPPLAPVGAGIIPPVQPVIPTAVEGSKSSSHLLPIIFSSLVTIVILVGGYFLFLNKPQQAITTNSSPLPSVTALASADPISTWKTYTNNVRKYSIKYPENWVIDSSKAETSTEDLEGAFLNFSNGSYELSIVWPSAFGPQICLFDDESRVGAPEFASYCEGKFIEIASGSKRRLEKPEILSDRVQWSVYSKNKEYHVTVPPISYSAPVKYNEQEIKTMDQILSSYQSI